ncbi:MAG: hypothetical protein LBD01_06685 [Puniceicoccales bacterium]|jgi:hypothetical protein|nr:hypothetical protein [Puniceicoccales bacterium]
MSHNDNPDGPLEKITETPTDQAKLGHLNNETAKEDAPASATRREDKTPHPSLAESALEASHADLPPLSNIIASASENTAPQAENRSSTPRRGIGRSTAASNSANNATRPSIGVVQSPETVTENLSGQFANGYSDQPEHAQRKRPQRPQQQEQHPQQTSTEARPPATNVFVPPISQKTYKAEMDPEQERRRREGKRNSREAGNSREGGNAREAGNAPTRRANQTIDWSPGENKPNANTYKNNQLRPQKFTVDPPSIPEMQKDNLWTRLKEFFTNLFRGKSEEQPSTPNDDGKKDKYHHFGKGQGGSGYWQKHRGNRKNRYRHGNRSPGGNPQNYNRDARHRPHAHGGENRH